MNANKSKSFRVIVIKLGIYALISMLFKNIYYNIGLVMFSIGKTKLFTPHVPWE